MFVYFTGVYYDPFSGEWFLIFWEENNIDAKYTNVIAECLTNKPHLQNKQPGIYNKRSKRSLAHCWRKGNINKIQFYTT